MKTLSLIISLFVCYQTYAQIVIRNLSLVKPDSNVLLTEISNKIEIHGTNLRTNIISKNGASILSKGGNTFDIKSKNLNPDTLLVYAGNKLLLRKVFIIDTIPELSIQLGSIDSDTSNVYEVIANKALVAIFKGSLLKNPIKVTGFKTIFIEPSSEIQDQMLSSQGNMLSTEQIAVIKNLKKNSKILFDDILAMTPDTRKRRLSPFIITIR